MLSRREFIGLGGVLTLGSCAGCSGEGGEWGSFGEPDVVRPVLSAQGAGFRLLTGDRGAIVVEVGGESYTIESFYSYPGDSVGTNALSSKRQRGDAWRLDIEKVGPDEIRIIARGKSYTLTRTLLVKGLRVEISDELVNQTNEALGILIHHRVATDRAPREVLFAGAPWDTGGIWGTGKNLVKQGLLTFGLLAPSVGYSAENPTFFISLKGSHLGVIAEDTLSRLQFEGHRNRAAFSMEHFALRPNGAHTLKWSLYVLSGEADYFTFINAVRRDWKTGFAVSGPWDFFDLIDRWELLDQTERLQAYFQRKRLQIVALRPWLDYDHFNWRTGRTVSRSEYKRLVRRGVAALKAVDPEIKCLGCMQSCWVSLPSELMRTLYETIPSDLRKQGIYQCTDKQMELLRGISLAWKDSLVMGPDGRYIYELYYNGPQKEPLVAIAAYAAPGNAQFDYWMEQAKFLLEDVGLDGVYIDGFSLAFKSNPSQRYSYDHWDGVTVDISPKTGNVLHRYTDAAWVGVQAQEKLIRYVLSRSGIFVANTAASAKEVQSLPVMRFIEASDVMSTFVFVEGKEPPIDRHLCRGQLGSPIALGWRPPDHRGEEAGPEYIRKIVEAAITYLRHGLLYYHYGHYGFKVSEIGSGPGDYDVISHMFPITPTSIGEGFVAGRERIVTCVSRTFSWQEEREPHILLFDIMSQPRKPGFSLQKAPVGWKVTVQLKDWKEIAIVE